MKEFRKSVKVGNVSIPTGFASSANGEKLSTTWNGILMTVSVFIVPFIVQFFAQSGITITQEQGVALVVTVAVSVYGVLRKALMVVAKKEVDHPTEPGV